MIQGNWWCPFLSDGCGYFTNFEERSDICWTHITHMDRWSGFLWGGWRPVTIPKRQGYSKALVNWVPSFFSCISIMIQAPFFFVWDQFFLSSLIGKDSSWLSLFLRNWVPKICFLFWKTKILSVRKATCFFSAWFIFTAFFNNFKQFFWSLFCKFGFFYIERSGLAWS